MLRVTLILIPIIFFIGCRGSSSDSSPVADNNEADVNQLLDQEVTIGLVNVSNQSLDFFYKQTDNSAELFSNQFLINTINNNQNRDYSFNWTETVSLRADIGARNTNDQTTTASIEDTLLNRADDIWVVAWQDEGELILSSDDKSVDNQSNRYRVRLFALEKTFVQVVGAAVSTTEVDKGQFSTPILLDNCNGELFFGANPIDICELELGKSYLVIMDGEDILYSVEETK